MVGLGRSELEWLGEVAGLGGSELEGLGESELEGLGEAVRRLRALASRCSVFSIVSDGSLIVVGSGRKEDTEIIKWREDEY